MGLVFINKINKAKFKNYFSPRYLKLTAIIVIATELTFALIHGLYFYHSYEKLKSSTQTQAEFLSSISTEPLLQSDFATIKTLLNSTTRDLDWIYAVVIDSQKRVISYSFQEKNTQLQQIDTETSSPQAVAVTIEEIKGKRYIQEISSSIIIGQENLGEVRIGYSYFNLKQEMLHILLTDAVICLFFGMIIAFFLTERQRTVTALRDQEILKLANAELLKNARLKDEFLANISHELRTPLNSILGLTEVLQLGVYGSLNIKQSKALSSVEKSSQHLLNLISEILLLVNLESEETQGNFTDISTLSEKIISLIQPELDYKKLYFSSEVPKQLPLVEVNELQLQQVLLNLLNNAIKFTPSGGKVNLEVQPNPQQKLIHFIVTDTGIGIAAEDKEKIFNCCIQADGSLSRHYEGLGLGLTVVKKIVDLYGGQIEVESELGQGSKFTISFPY